MKEKFSLELEDLLKKKRSLQKPTGFGRLNVCGAILYAASFRVLSYVFMYLFLIMVYGL